MTSFDLVLEGLQASVAELRSAIELQSSGILHSQPAPGKWSVLEVICHLVDTEKLIFRARMERLLTESKPFFPDIDHLPWVQEHGYSHQDLAAKLEEFRLEREATIRLLLELLPGQWELQGKHQVRGDITLGDIAEYCVSHTRVHIEQIRRTIQQVIST